MQSHCLTLNEAKDPAGTIHQLRLVAKALRAVLRLADDGQPKPDLMQRDTALRRWAGQISKARDCEVQGTLFRRLARKGSKDVQSIVERMIRRHMQPHPLVERVALVRDGLCSEAVLLSQTLPNRISPGGISRAIRRSLRKTQAWRTRAVDDLVPDDFHAWRRWQKRLEAQLRLVGNGQVRDTGALLDELHAIQEDLGALHDADELATFLGRSSVWKGVAPATRKDLLRLVADRQKSLRKRLVRESRKVLGVRLKKSCKATARLWEKAAKTA